MTLIATYQAQRQALLRDFPELADDLVTLTDTLEGISNLPEVIAHLIQDSIEDLAMAKALKEIIEQYRDRRTRLEHRAASRRTAAFQMMQAADMRKLERPEFTLSIGPTRPSVIVTDRAALPDEYWRVQREPNKTAIHEALDRGERVPGATLSNAAETLRVRTR